MDKALNERYALNESRTYAQLGKQSAQTIYSGQTNGIGGPYSSWGGGSL